MREILFPALLLAVILTACAHTQPPIPTATPEPTPTATATPTPSPTPTVAATPTEEPTELWGFPIDDTHDAFEVDTKGKLGTVLVTVEKEGDTESEFGDFLFAFSVWDTDNLTAPIQTMTAESWGSFHQHDVVDANFDGYMDFCYLRSWGTGGLFFYHWIWDEEKGLFTAVPELTEYGDVVLDAETETVIAHVKCGFAGLDAWDDIYVWKNGSPVCVRKIQWSPRLEEDTIAVKITVSDRINGELTEVFSAQSNENDFWDEAKPWYDLSYHG